MAGLLDGDLKEVFGSVFAPLLLDAVLTKVTLTPDGEGGLTESTVTAAAKGMVEQYSAYERAQVNVPLTDVKLIVLQKDVDLIPDVDSRVLIRGQLYSIQSVEQDPAQAAWTFQARPINAPTGPNLVSVSAAATGAASAGVPRLTLIVDNTAAAVADAHAPPVAVLIEGEASASAEAGAVSRGVLIGADASAVADAGEPVTGGAFTGDASAIAEAGTPSRAFSITGEASAVAEAGAPVTDADFTGDAEAVAEVGAPRVSVNLVAVAAAVADVGTPAGAVAVSGNAGAVSDAGTPRVGVSASGEASAVADTGTPRVSVPVDAEASAVGDAGSVTRAVAAQADAEAAADAGTPQREALLAGDASAVADALPGVSVVKVISADASAVADAGTVQRGVPVSATLDAVAEAAALLLRTVPLSGNGEAVADAGGALLRAVLASGNAEAEADAGSEIDVEAGAGGGRTTPVLRSTASVEDSLTVAKPSGVVEGDLLIGFWADFEIARDIDPPAGWTAIGTTLSHGGDLNLRAAYKIAGPSEPSSYTATIDIAQSFAMGMIAAFSSVDTSDPIAAFTTATGSSSVGAIPSVTAANDNSYLVGLMQGYETGSTPPSGMSLLASEFTTYMFGQTSISAGATGVKNTSTSQGLWASFGIVINGAPS